MHVHIHAHAHVVIQCIAGVCYLDLVYSSPCAWKYCTTCVIIMMIMSFLSKPIIVKCAANFRCLLLLRSPPYAMHFSSDADDWFKYWIGLIK